MLNSLHVKNLALIDEAEIDFTEGLNILTGETGAGKSIIIGSIMLALGGKGDRELIRSGADCALIELSFQVSPSVCRICEESMGISADEDGVIIITRKITPQKSVFRINGETVTAKQVKELSGALLDIYGQNEHQSLTKKSSQLKLLDDYAGERAAELKSETADLYQRYNSLKKEYTAFDIDDNQRNREIALCEFELDEINSAGLKEGEDEALEKEYRRMRNAKKTAQSCSLAWDLMAGSDDDNAALLISRALREIREAGEYDEGLAGIQDALASVEDIIEDTARSLSSYMDELEFSPEKFDEVESRLNLINGLKSKYGESIPKITRYRLEIEKKLEDFEHYSEKKQQLKEHIEQVYNTLLSTCEKLSALRKKEAVRLSESMKEVLRELNFLQVEFEIKTEADSDRISPGGYDEVSYLVSTNPGEKPRPVEDIASGGELSRIMLGLKTVLADADDCDTFIFDEIDTGISGQTAWKVAQRMRSISSGHQVICITHLPQIAAGADTHFRIEKHVEKGHTFTRIYQLSEEDSVTELARMSGGDVVTELTLAGAREMKQKAHK